MKQPLLALLAASLLAVASAPAFAHTTVRETSIADNAALSASPANFTITFSGGTALANVTLTNAVGHEVALNYTPPHAMAAVFTIPLPALAPGAYTLSWRSMSHDGHVMPGAIHFTVAG